jgi:hypothetical protein
MRVINYLLSEYRESNEGLREQLPEDAGLMVWDMMFVQIPVPSVSTARLSIRFKTS